MSFGLTGAPATFSRIMHQVLKGTKTIACVYLDDEQCRLRTFDEHFKHLAVLFQRLQEA